MIKIDFERENQYLVLSLKIDNPFRDDSLLQPTSGKVDPRYFLQEIVVIGNDRVIFSAQLNPLMAANPTLTFRVKHISKGSPIKVKWQDNLGQSGNLDFFVSV